MGMKPNADEVKLLLSGRKIIGHRLSSGLMSAVTFEVVDEVGGQREGFWSLLLRAKNMDTGKEKLWIVSPKEGWILDFRKTADDLNPWAGQY